MPLTAKISKEAKECVQECVSEFISFITSEAAEKCQMEKRKTIGGEDILYAMVTLGFENYAETLKIHLAKLRQVRPLSSSRPYLPACSFGFARSGLGIVLRGGVESVLTTVGRPLFVCSIRRRRATRVTWTAAETTDDCGEEGINGVPGLRLDLCCVYCILCSFVCLSFAFSSARDMCTPCLTSDRLRKVCIRQDRRYSPLKKQWYRAWSAKLYTRIT